MLIVNIHGNQNLERTHIYDAYAYNLQNKICLIVSIDPDLNPRWPSPWDIVIIVPEATEKPGERC
jgi:hypothetical protein